MATAPCLFDKGDIYLNALEEIKDFSERYVVSREHVESYLTHLQSPSERRQDKKKQVQRSRNPWTTIIGISVRTRKARDTHSA